MPLKNFFNRHLENNNNNSNDKYVIHTHLLSLTLRIIFIYKYVVDMFNSEGKVDNCIESYKPSGC